MQSRRSSDFIADTIRRKDLRFVEYFKKNWGILSALALFIVGILSTFLIEPESYIVSEKTFSNWGKFVAAIVIGLVLVTVIIFKSRHHTVKWWLTAASMLLLSVASFFHIPVSSPKMDVYLFQ